MKVAERISRLFDDDGPPLDGTGTLEALARVLAPHKPTLVLAARSDGSVQAVYGVDETDRSAAEIRTLARAAVDPTGHAEPFPESLGVPWIVEAGRDDRIVIAWLRRAPKRKKLQAAEDTARIALASLEHHAERDRLESRTRQLRNELDALTQSHDRIVTELLEMKEEQAVQHERYVETLEQEVERRSTALRDALLEARTANQAKSTFLATMSHEIRTPLTAILGYADLLKEESPSNEIIEEYSDVIRSNGQTLLGILNDVLDYSKIEAKAMKIDVQDLDLGDVVREVVRDFESMAGEKSIELTSDVSCDARLRSDAACVKQILHKLIENAIKFTDAGRVQVRVMADSLEHRIAIEISDTGIGLTSDAMGQLFLPFMQIDSSSTRRFGGTGLGLSIARNLARMLGGDITVTSEAERGSIFRVTLLRCYEAPNEK